MIDMTDILRSDKTFRYMLLSRMKSDCDYYLGFGNRYAGHLWAQNERDHIECMKAIWNSFSANDKPEWLTFEQLLDYEKKLIPEKTPLVDQIQAAAARSAAEHTPPDVPAKAPEH